MPFDKKQKTLDSSRPALKKSGSRHSRTAIFAAASLASACWLTGAPASGQATLSDKQGRPLSNLSSSTKITKEMIAPSSIAVAQPFQSVEQSLRLEGEDSTLQWPVYLTESQAQTTRHFRLGYLAAISVMPEASELTLTINDKAIGITPIKAPGAVRVLDFEIPQGVLKPGYNAVTVSAVQRHRVDCSLQATYELWTEVDPSWTGFVVGSNALPVSRLEDLPAIAPNNQGLVPIEVILGRKPSLALMEQIIRAAQQIAIAGRYTHTVIEFAPEPRSSAGINLVLGSHDDLTSIASIKPLLSGIDRSVTFLPATGNRAATLIIRGDSPADLDSAIASLHQPQERPLFGSPQGVKLASIARGKKVADGETIQLADFGMASREFSGRYFKSDFDLNLPLDFLPADYSAIQLNIAGVYAAGLEAGSEIVVDINGRNAASIPLAKRDGGLLSDEKIYLPLGRLRPGYNHFQISALVPTAEDRICNTTRLKDERKRFLLSNTTSVQMPQFARALRLPDIAVTTNGGLPYALDGERPLLIVPSLDKDSLGAGATLAVQLATAAGHPIDFELSIDIHSAGSRSSLIVSPARSLDPALLASLGIDASKVQQIWQGRADPPPAAAASKPQSILADNDGMSLDRLRKNIPAACVLPTKAARAAPLPSTERQAQTSNFSAGYDRLDQTLQAQFGTSKSLRDLAFWTSASVGDSLTRAADSVGAWVKGQFSDPPVEIDPRSTLIVGQSLSRQGAHPVTTLVTAPNAELLNASVICLTTPSVWNQLEGRVAQLDTDTGSVLTTATNHSGVRETEARSFQNLRMVFAGWLSLNPSAFVFMILLTAVGLGVTTNAMLSGIGRPNYGAKRWKGKSVQKDDKKS